MTCRTVLGFVFFSLDSWYFDDELCRRTLKEHFHVGSLEGLGVGDYDCGIIAAGALFLLSEGNTENRAVPYGDDPSVCSRKVYADRQLQPQESLKLVENIT